MALYFYHTARSHPVATREQGACNRFRATVCRSVPSMDPYSQFFHTATHRPRVEPMPSAYERRYIDHWSI
eukprot:3419766-Prymnesium_polylepis.1